MNRTAKGIVYRSSAQSSLREAKIPNSVVNERAKVRALQILSQGPVLLCLRSC